MPRNYRMITCAKTTRRKGKMTVKELIEKLKSLDKNSVIVVDGYECGFNIANAVTEIKLIDEFPNGKRQPGWSGKYTVDFRQQPEQTPFSAVHIS